MICRLRKIQSSTRKQFISTCHRVMNSNGGIFPPESSETGFNVAEDHGGRKPYSFKPLVHGHSDVMSPQC